MPLEKTGESQKSGPSADFLVRETDLNRFFAVMQFNKLGHCLVSRFLSGSRLFFHEKSTTPKQWPFWLLHSYGLEGQDCRRAATLIYEKMPWGEKRQPIPIVRFVISRWDRCHESVDCAGGRCL